MVLVDVFSLANHDFVAVVHIDSLYDGLHAEASTVQVVPRTIVDQLRLNGNDTRFFAARQTDESTCSSSSRQGQPGFMGRRFKCSAFGISPIPAKVVIIIAVGQLVVESPEGVNVRVISSGFESL